MWVSPLVVTPMKIREAKNAFDKLYFAANAHVYMDKAGAAPQSVFSLSGRLVATKSGWIVLEVPMALVRGAFDALDEPGAEMPPPSSGYESYKSHISVFRPEELEQLGGIDKVTEKGHHFHYNLGPIQTVEPAGWSEMSKVWFIKVHSLELEKLRKSYGLSARPNDNKFNFHITVAVKRKNVLKENDVSKAAENLGPEDDHQPRCKIADVLGDISSVWNRGASNVNRWIGHPTMNMPQGKGIELSPAQGRAYGMQPRPAVQPVQPTAQPVAQQPQPIAQPVPAQPVQPASGASQSRPPIPNTQRPVSAPGIKAGEYLRAIVASVAKLAEDSGVTSISLTPDATELPPNVPETSSFPVQEKKPKQESKPTFDATSPWAGALKLAADLNERRGNKFKKVSLPVIGHYEAKSKVGRDAFLYQDPRGSKHDDFAECQTCHDFTGKSCENFSKGNTVRPTGSCGLYHHGLGTNELLGNELGTFTKEEAGYVEHPVRCENCAYFDDEEKYCELFEELTEYFPSVFDLKKEVHPKGCCNAHIARGRRFEEKEETQEAKTKTVAIDLDGTLAFYDGWRGEDVIGEVRPGAAEAVKWLKKKGHKVALWTTRGNTERLKKWLKENDIPVDYINENPNQPAGCSKKIIAEIYVDDRVIDARKAWSEIKKELAERLEEDHA